MRCTDPGVLAPSDYYFATPSAQAKSLFYYMLCAGGYNCTTGYHIRRKCYNSALLMYILDGNCIVKIEGKTAHAKKNDIILLNCYKEHEYLADGDLKTLWLHFDGSQSLDFLQNIHKVQGMVFPCENPTLFVDSLTGILEIFRQKQTISEPSISCIIHTMLCNLVSTTTLSGALDVNNDIVSMSMQYIKAHFIREITVEEMARQVSISPSHFSRLFKKQTGYSPYEYLIKIRLDTAKSLLKKTGLPISEIAIYAGFNSQSNFIYTFHAKVGISPAQFRNTPF